MRNGSVLSVDTFPGAIVRIHDDKPRKQSRDHERSKGESMSERRCLTPEEYAIERRVSTRTVYRLIKSGQVKAERVGAQWRIWLSRKTTSDTSASADA